MQNSPRFYIRGFTLIEIQVAILILLLIFSLIAGVLHFSAKSLKLSDKLTTQHNRQSVVGDLLRQQINSILPLKKADFGNSELFFKGEAQSIYYIGYLPSYLVRGGPWLINLYLNGSKQLILRYKPIDAQKSWQGNMQGDYQHVVLLDDINRLSISYHFGNVEVTESSWRAEWSNHDELPALVKINIQQSHIDWPEIVQPIYTSNTMDIPFHVLSISNK